MKRLSLFSCVFLIAFLGANALFSAEENSSPVARNSSIVFDFEDGTLQGWEVIDGWFEQIVSSRDFYHNRPTDPYNKQGKYYLSTVEQLPGKSSNDLMTGIVESPVLVLSSPNVSFLIGAAVQPKSYLAICGLDGTEKKIYRASADEKMIRVEDSWQEFVGVPIVIRLFDQDSTIGWAHVTFDDFHCEGRIDEELTTLHRLQNEIPRLQKKAQELSKSLESLLLEAEDYVFDATDFCAEAKAKIEQFTENLNRPLNEFTRENIESYRTLFETLNSEIQQQIHEKELQIVSSLDDLSQNSIVYVSRKPYESHYHAIDTLFNSDEFNCERTMPHKNLFSPGSSLKLWNVESGRELTLIDLPDGVVRDPDVDFDASRIILSIRTDRDSDYSIWEMTLNGKSSFNDLLNDSEMLNVSRDNYRSFPGTSGPVFYHPGIELKRLTNASCVADFDPIYLPDGTVVFSSTREPKYNMCSRDIASDLYRMNGDGSNIYQITKSTLFEHNPFLLPDGRICYHRWEYVDRNFGDAHALWVVTPDGLNQSIYWGNNTAVPGAIYNPNFIEETGEMLCIFGPHHARENGALAIIDRRLGIDDVDPVVQIWPENFRSYIRAEGGFDCDTTVGAVPLKFEDPYVVDDSHFLVARMIVRDGKMGMYLVDRDHHEIFLKEESENGIYDPVLIRPRQKPTLLVGNRDFSNNNGTCYIENVNIGTHMKSVAVGDAKYLRIVQSPEKRNFSCGSWFGQGYTAPGMNWHSLENKKILGTVEIEEDGSTAFEVPCDTFLFFQLLDKNGRMLQTMRSGTVLQSNEKISCIGCHENRLETFANNASAEHITMAMKKKPQTLQTWYGEPREFGYMKEVQPVFDRHCVECHDYGKPAGEKLNLAADRDLVFNTSYVNLWNSSYIKCIGAGPAELQESLAWGSNVSPLIQEIEHPKIQEHIDIKLNEKLSKEEMDRLCTWIDLNGVYYPYYESAWPSSNTGRSPYSREEMNELGQLVGMSYADNFGHWLWPKPEVCFERPELSPALERLVKKLQEENPVLTQEEAKQSEQYQKALEMIKMGWKRLQERPRADMPGFVPCEKDQERLKKYDFRRSEELRFRKAIQNKTKAFD